jgi:RimJ/RimL family protein N-acetyltransferase
VTQLLYGCDDIVSAWVANMIPHVTEFDKSAAIGVVRNGNIIAGMVYHDYQPEAKTMQLSMAASSPRWAVPAVIKGLLAYPFRQIGVFKVWTATPQDNIRALRVNEHVGFKREAVLAHHFGPKRHAVICRMLAPDFKRIFGDG